MVVVTIQQEGGVEDWSAANGVQRGMEGSRRGWRRWHHSPGEG
jgi:hypothetical protein